jgi:hypothetical protein
MTQSVKGINKEKNNVALSSVIVSFGLTIICIV